MTKGRECEGKLKRTKADAKKYALFTRVKFRSNIYAYKCPHCGFYHVGHRNVLGHRPRTRRR